MLSYICILVVIIKERKSVDNFTGLASKKAHRPTQPHRKTITKL